MNDYTTIECQIVKDEEDRATEIKTKMFQWYLADFAIFTLEIWRLIRYKDKWQKIEKKIVLVTWRNKRKVPNWFIIQIYWDGFKKIMLL